MLKIEAISSLVWSLLGFVAKPRFGKILRFGKLTTNLFCFSFHFISSILLIKNKRIRFLLRFVIEGYLQHISSILAQNNLNINVWTLEVREIFVKFWNINVSRFTVTDNKNGKIYGMLMFRVSLQLTTKWEKDMEY